MILARRRFLQGALAGAAALTFADASLAQSARVPFPQWVASFRPRALARGISAATYDRVMNSLKPDTSVYALQRSQPEFEEQTWQYVYRRVSDWRIRTGKEVAKQHAGLLSRIEREHGVDRYLLLALWGVESAYGDPVVQQKYMRPVFPALAALAWGEPRRRTYWEKELINALIIVERRWSTPDEMRGSWAGAMGHTQWMPEVWLNVGIDYDGDACRLSAARPTRSLRARAIWSSAANTAKASPGVTR
jgi:membrane-bound lytic murein transglycosylase B